MSVRRLLVWVVSAVCFVGFARADSEPQKPKSYITIRHVGEQDKPVTTGIVGTSQDGLAGLLVDPFELRSFVVLSQTEFDEVLSYVRGHAGVPADKKRRRPFFGTFEVAWSESGRESRYLVPWGASCSYFGDLAGLSAARSSPAFMKYVVFVRKCIRCSDQPR